MIQNLKLKNFRSFESWEFNFWKGINLIIWNNWKGKSNILEAISLSISWDSLNKIPFENLVKKDSNENLFFLQGEFFSEDKFIVSDIAYDKELNKKKIFLNKKATTKTNLKKNTFPIVSFTPIDMNLMYLSPSLRREFIFNTIKEAHIEFKKLYKTYSEILRHRNSLLKNIKEWLSRKDEIIFWDKKFIEISTEIYSYIIPLIRHYKENITSENEFFLWKFDEIKFEYKTKVDLTNIEKSLNDYLKQNLEKDIIIWRTTIWPNSDDFDIYIDSSELINIASRGETKSVILGLKFLELDFIEKRTNKKSILLIDDLISELDEIHKKMLLDRIKNNQSIIANIFPIDWENTNTILL